jgi:RNA methyltransferase, RsmE family
VFDGGGEWSGEVIDHQTFLLRAHHAVEREADVRVMLAVGMPANERMDSLVEKAVELGVAAIQPLLTRRSVLRLQGERAQRRVAHWQGVAIAACEQCGRNRVPEVAPVATLSDWLQHLGNDNAQLHRCVLSPLATTPLLPFASGESGWMVSGPRGRTGRRRNRLAAAIGVSSRQPGAARVARRHAPLAALMRACG